MQHAKYVRVCSSGGPYCYTEVDVTNRLLPSLGGSDC